MLLRQAPQAHGIAPPDRSRLDQSPTHQKYSTVMYEGISLSPDLNQFKHKQ